MGSVTTTPIGESDRTDVNVGAIASVGGRSEERSRNRGRGIFYGRRDFPTDSPEWPEGSAFVRCFWWRCADRAVRAAADCGRLKRWPWPKRRLPSSVTAGPRLLPAACQVVVSVVGGYCGNGCCCWRTATAGLAVTWNWSLVPWRGVVRGVVNDLLDPTPTSRVPPCRIMAPTALERTARAPRPWPPPTERCHRRRPPLRWQRLWRGTANTQRHAPIGGTREPTEQPSETGACSADRCFQCWRRPRPEVAHPPLLAPPRRRHPLTRRLRQISRRRPSVRLTQNTLHRNSSSGCVALFRCRFAFGPSIAAVQPATRRWPISQWLLWLVFNLVSASVYQTNIYYVNLINGISCGSLLIKQPLRPRCCWSIKR